MTHWSRPVRSRVNCPRCRKPTVVTFDQIGELTSTGAVPEHSAGPHRCGASGQVIKVDTAKVWKNEVEEIERSKRR